MGINIKFHDQPELTHINLRKEGQEGMEEIAVDLKINGLAKVGPNGEVLQKLLGCEPEYATSFWVRPVSQEDAVDLGDDGPEVAFHGITAIKSWAEFKGGHTAYIAGLTFHPSQIKKFSVTPRAGLLLEMEFQVSITGLDNRELQILTEHLRESLPCEIEAEPDLFEEDAA